MSLKVIGAGLPRTGTTSLKVALQMLLGAPCYHITEIHHHPEHAKYWLAAAKGDPVNWDELFSGYAAAVDTPTCLFWPELMQAYPQAIVLLSVREAQSWLESCKQTILKGPRPPGRGPGGGPAKAQGNGKPSERRQVMDAVVQARLSFMRGSNPEATIRGYEQHNSAVRAGVPAERLLIWGPQDGWGPLCAALHLPVPNMPFPHLNTRRVWRYRSMLEYVVGRRLAEKAVRFVVSQRARRR